MDPEALFDLILNARDAMPVGGRLQVQTSRLLVDWQPLRAGLYIAVTVAGTGIGAHASKDALFDGQSVELESVSAST